MPIITVIVPVYNVEPYLRRCVDSILAQTFTDFELILVDDGSPDNCGAICDEYAALDPRVNAVHQSNGGLSAARNSGIDWAFANSSSEWFSFIDSDDWVHPRFLEFLYRAAAENEVNISDCSFVRTEKQTDYSEHEYSSSVLPWDEFYLNDPVIGAIACNKLYKKELFSEARYPVGRLHEDEFLTYKLLYAAGKVAFIPLELYYYYQNPEGIMKTEFSLKRLDAVDALTEQCRFANAVGNKAFFENRVKSLILCCATDLIQLRKTANRSKQFKDADRKLRVILRRLLFKYGAKHTPFDKYSWCYETAYVTASRFCWTCTGISRKLKRIVKRDAED